MPNGRYKSNPTRDKIKTRKYFELFEKLKKSIKDNSDDDLKIDFINSVDGAMPLIYQAYIQIVSNENSPTLDG